MIINIMEDIISSCRLYLTYYWNEKISKKYINALKMIYSIHLSIIAIIILTK